MDNSDYYLRYNKSFNRMGGTMRYVTADIPLTSFCSSLAQTPMQTASRILST